MIKNFSNTQDLNLKNRKELRHYDERMSSRSIKGQQLTRTQATLRQHEPIPQFERSSRRQISPQKTVASGIIQHQIEPIPQHHRDGRMIERSQTNHPVPINHGLHQNVEHMGYSRPKSPSLNPIDRNLISHQREHHHERRLSS